MDDLRKDYPNPERPLNNGRPITCLPMMWKILTEQIKEEQNGFHKGTRETGDLLYIDQHILKESKMKRKNLAMARVDYKKTIDTVLQSWITDCLELHKIYEELKQMDQRTRKYIMIHKAFHPRDDIDRLYVTRKGGKALANIQDSFDASIQRLGYIKIFRGRLMTETRNNTDNTSINRTKLIRNKNGKKQLYGHLKRQISDISHEKT